MDPSYNQAPPQVPQQPQMQPMQPISSGAGDIVLDNGTKKKSRKGLIVLIVILMVVAIAGIVTAVVLNRGGETAEERGAKAAYNSFMNYVLSGEESTVEFDYDEIGGESDDVYFEKVEESDDDNLKAEYAAKAGELYNNLVREFATYEEKNNTEENWGELMGVMNDFYVKCVTFEDLSYDEILESYVNNGREATVALIDERYAGATEVTESVVDGAAEGDAEATEEVAPSFGQYLAEEKKLADWYLNFAEAKVAAGCVVEGVIQDSCYEMTDEEIVNMWDYSGASNDVRLALWGQAEYVARGLYGVFYDLGEHTEYEGEIVEETEEEEE